jgi:hypothetical protein
VHWRRRIFPFVAYAECFRIDLCGDVRASDPVFIPVFIPVFVPVFVPAFSPIVGFYSPTGF